MNLKFQALLQKYLLPLANKVEQQKHLQSIKDGMMSIIPITILGSFCLLPLAIVNLIQSGPINEFFSSNLSLFTYPEKFTLGMLALYSAFFIAEALSKKYNLKSSLVGITAVIVHIVLCASVIEGGIGTQYLGAEGLFTSIISAIFVAEVTRFMIAKKLYIKLPDSVPPMVSNSFSSLLPMVVTVCIAGFVSVMLKNSTDKLFPEIIMSILAPAVSSMDTLPAMLIIIFLTQLLWFFGLHGAAITSAVWVPFAVSYGAANIANYAAGQPVEHFFTFGFYYALLQVSGSGLTLGLVILMIRSKSKSLSSVAKAAIIPSCFGINEPVIFGCPIILNPFLFVPFVFGPLIVTTICYFALSSGIVGMPIAEPPGFLPPGLGAFLMTLDIKAPILVLICLILMTIFYYPFFKAMEEVEIKKEQELIS